MNNKKRLLYLASKNPHKLEELQTMIPDASWEIKLASDLNPNISWDETGKSFEENAFIKALVVKQYTNAAVLADDSGLCVDYLNGAPGIHSSRYAGENATDLVNRIHLLNELTGVAERARGAKFLCCLVFIDEEDKKSVVLGSCKGRIIEEERGENGFGYDPLFLIEHIGKTMAELPSAEKNRLSHRNDAVKAWLTSIARST